MCIRYWKRGDDIAAGILGGVLAIGLAIGGLASARSLSTMEDRYELLSVAVETRVKHGQPVNVSILRRIHRDFLGHYVATVRRLDAVAPVCNGGDEVHYRRMTPAELDKGEALVRTLDWWTEGARPPCQGAVDELGPGQYVLTMCIHDDSGGLMNAIWPRHVCRDSNPFEVIP